MENPGAGLSVKWCSTLINDRSEEGPVQHTWRDVRSLRRHISLKTVRLLHKCIWSILTVGVSIWQNFFLVTELIFLSYSFLFALFAFIFFLICLCLGNPDTCSLMNRQKDRQTNKQTDRQTDRHHVSGSSCLHSTDRKTDRQTNKQTDRQTDTMCQGPVAFIAHTHTHTQSSGLLCLRQRLSA